MSQGISIVISPKIEIRDDSVACQLLILILMRGDENVLITLDYLNSLANRDNDE